MSCRICKRGNCTESFHSFEEQEEAERLREGRLSPAERDELEADQHKGDDSEDT